MFFYEQTWEALLDTLLSFDHTAWDSEAIRAWTEKFDESRFTLQIKKYVQETYDAFQQELRQCQLEVR